MSICETCIRRPVMTALLTASLICLGIFGYRLLAVAALPAVDYPTIQISATLPGASPETMGAAVAGPIERALSAISGVSSITLATLAIPAAGGTLAAGANLKALLRYTMLLLNDGSRGRVRERKAEA